MRISIFIKQNLTYEQKYDIIQAIARVNSKEGEA